jgi:TonB dependent receptor
VNANNSVNGSPQLSANVTMDGITTGNAEVFGTDQNVRFPPEAVAEMSIVTTAYAAEYGQTGGGVQRYEIKSGTNQYHGNVYEFLKNTDLDSRGFFNLVRPTDHQDEYGFSLGGPVIIPKVYNGKNRSFFFFNADWYKTVSASATTITSLPNAAYRTGDFSASLGGAIGAPNPCTGSPVLSGQIFDPASTRLVNGQYCRTPFPNNMIPASRISPAAEGILGLLPATTTSAVVNNSYLPAAPSFNNFNDYTIKGDQYFGSKHHLSMMFLDSANPSGGGQLLNGPLETWGGTTYYSWDFSRLTEDWSISPTVLNTLRLAYNREIFYHRPTGSSGSYSTGSYSDPNWASTLGGVGIPGFETASHLFPGIIFGTSSYSSPYTTLGNQQFWYATSNTYVLNDSVAWSHGSHNFKFGFEYDDMWHALWKDWPAQLTFARNETALPTAIGSTGNEIASFLLGYVDNANIPNLANTSVNYKAPQMFSLYAQDDFKVTSRLTVNYGLRWELYKPIYEEHNIYGAVDLSMPNPSAGGLLGSYTFAGQNGVGSCLPSACKSAAGWGPRLGLAYRLSDRFVVRAGYGISYFPTGLYGAGNNAYMTDGYDPTSTAATGNNGITPAFTLAQGFPASDLQTRNLTSSYCIGCNFDYWSRYAQTIGQTQSWNFSFQTRLTPNLSLDTAYVGTKGTHLTVPENINQMPDAYLGLGASLLESINSPAVAAAGFTQPWPGFAAALGTKATLAQALRPFPQYLVGYGYNSDNDGNSTYNAFQVKLEKRVSQGLYALVSYTYDKYITDANTTLLATPGNNPANSGVVRDQDNRHLDKSIASAWQPHVLTAAIEYELPIGPGKRFLATGGIVGRLTGGWRVGAILTYHTGSLISVVAPQTLPNFAGPNTANTVLGMPQMGSWSGRFDPATDRYLNVNAFTVPEGYGTGGIYLPNLFGPTFKEEDLSLSKRTMIRERFNLELRLEAFNAFNRVIFGTPNSDISVPQSFGFITSQANLPRTAQIAMKLNF